MRKITLLSDALRQCTTHFVSAAAFSMGVNLLFLSPTVYMMQISDRVMSSGSKETLVFLTLAYLLATMTLGGLDYVRSEVLIRAGLRLDRLLAEQIMGLMLEHANAGGRGGRQRDEMLRALDDFRGFLTGSGIHALFDVPWMPIYILALFFVHPVICIVSTAFMALQTVVTLGTERLMKGPITASLSARANSYGLADAALRNAEVVAGMGMAEAITEPWLRDRRVMMDAHAIASGRNAFMTAVGRFLRLFVQGLIVAIGAYYALDRSISPGAMFAGMLLIGRASQPLDQILGAWKGIVGARQSYAKLKSFLMAPSPRETSMVLPHPIGIVSVEDLAYAPPRAQAAVFSGLNFTLMPGTCLGVIGPSGAGKSCLSRLMVGVHRPSRGVARLDGADIFTWDRADFGRRVGYLPQDIELFGGTVAQNITRFRPIEPQEVIGAAKLAGAHEMIIKLPNGYETFVGDAGAILSGGQRQLIGLARAVFGNPCFVVLDEPNSNLDTDGEGSLAQCLQALKMAKTTVIMISHRPRILEQVDQVLYMMGGQSRIYSREEFFSRSGPGGNLPSFAGASH